MNLQYQVVHMRVVAVTPFSPGDESATVTVTDGKYVCRCFCWPCSVEVGDEITEPLSLFNVSDLMLTEEREVWLETLDTRSRFEHRGVARVENRENQLLAIGGLQLTADGFFPGGIEAGDLVEFRCGRIDVR